MNLSNLLKFLPLILGTPGGGDSKLGGFLTPIFNMLGLSGEELENVMIAVKRLIDGDIDLKMLIPIALPLITNFLGNEKSASTEFAETDETFESYLKLEPVESFADEKIYSNLYSYFDSETLS